MLSCMYVVYVPLGAFCIVIYVVCVNCIVASYLLYRLNCKLINQSHLNCWLRNYKIVFVVQYYS